MIVKIILVIAMMKNLSKVILILIITIIKRGDPIIMTLIIILIITVLFFVYVTQSFKCEVVHYIVQKYHLKRSIDLFFFALLFLEIRNLIQ